MLVAASFHLHLRVCMHNARVWFVVRFLFYVFVKAAPGSLSSWSMP